MRSDGLSRINILSLAQHVAKHRPAEPVPDFGCPLCGGRLVIFHGKYGPFTSCTNWPECTYKTSFVHPDELARANQRTPAQTAWVQDRPSRPEQPPVIVDGLAMCPECENVLMSLACAACGYVYTRAPG